MEGSDSGMVICCLYFAFSAPRRDRLEEDARVLYIAFFFSTNATNEKNQIEFLSQHALDFGGAESLPHLGLLANSS